MLKPCHQWSWRQTRRWDPVLFQHTLMMICVLVIKWMCICRCNTAWLQNLTQIIQNYLLPQTAVFWWRVQLTHLRLYCTASSSSLSVVLPARIDSHGCSSPLHSVLCHWVASYPSYINLAIDYHFLVSAVNQAPQEYQHFSPVLHIQCSLRRTSLNSIMHISKLAITPWMCAFHVLVSDPYERTDQTYHFCHAIPESEM